MSQSVISRHQFSKIAVIWILASCLACSSNSSDLDRYEIEGNVTFKNQPIPYGTIQLIPDSELGNSGPGSTGVIENGQFQIPAARGIVGGAYIAIITGYAAPPQSTGENSVTGKLLFEEYQFSVELPAEKSTQSFTVPAVK